MEFSPILKVLESGVPRVLGYLESPFLVYSLIKGYWVLWVASD